MTQHIASNPPNGRRPTSALAAILLALALAITAVPAEARDRGVAMLPVPPDACWPATMILGGPPPVPSTLLLGGTVEAYSDWSAPSALAGQKAKPVALIVNGNGYILSDYEDLASHLARAGFIAAVAQRPGGGADPVEFSLAALEAVLDHFGLSPDTPVGLVGHSVGGGVVVNAAVRNHEQNLGFAIEAVIGLAPQVGNVPTHLDAEHAPAYLLIYGSQDQDVHGLSNVANDAFAAYDLAGHEGSTTCHRGVCRVAPGLDRTMLFIHGADHSGLINRTPTCPIGGCAEPFNSYLTTASQFCISKAYTEAFLRWAVADDPLYHKMVRGRWRPASIQNMVTALPDELGNPAGSPLRMRFQVGPARRSVIESFEDGAWEVSAVTPAVMTQLFDSGELLGTSANVRHLSRWLAVGWPQEGSWQLIGFKVPAGRRNVSTFTHVALRAGQLSALLTPDVANPANSSQLVLLGLSDGQQSSWRWLKPIPPNDLRPSGKTHSVMSTFAERLTGFSGIDKSNLESVLLAFPQGSQGTLLIDSLEWFRD
jgi:hypothetical protein